MSFIPPLLIMLFAITMLGVWMLDTKRRYMIFFGMSFAVFACGLLVQILSVFSRLDLTALAAAAFHLIACYLFCEAVMLRLAKHFSFVISGVISVITLCIIGYMMLAGINYSYMATVASLGLGLMLTILCFQAREPDWVDLTGRIFRISLIAFAAYFILRSFFTASMLQDVLSHEHLLQSKYWIASIIALSFSGVLLGLIILVVATSDVIKELQHERDADPLTGVLNRRGLERYANQKLVKDSRSYQAVIIADIDHFKGVNDDLGHAAGDMLLAEFSKLLCITAGSGSVVSRIGGEEFLILVKGSPEQCEMLGNRLCNNVARQSFLALPAGRRITSSFGIAMLREDETLWETVKRADMALMQVKRRGRNRVCVDGHEFPRFLPASYLLTA
ncbi:GGDEF domain-containing protein [Brucella sp. 21LCYQ03]|nr:GGDEF domain-containing protein [Brucella sp. 21LCYQ03]